MKVVDKVQGLEPGKRDFRIDQHFAQHFVHYGACLSSPSPFSMQSNYHPFLQFDVINQLGNKAEILINCGIPIPLFLFYSRISFNLGLQRQHSHVPQAFIAGQPGVVSRHCHSEIHFYLKLKYLKASQLF